MTELSFDEIDGINGGMWPYVLLAAYEAYQHGKDFYELGVAVYGAAKSAGEWVATH